MYENFSKVTRRITTGLICLVLVIAVLGVSLPQQQASAALQTVTCSTYHTVVAGETLSSIAEKYNTTYQQIAAANDLKEPYTLYVGQRLCIPGSATTTSTATPSTGTTTTTTGPDFTIKASSDPYFFEIATIGYPAKTSFYIRVYQTSNPSITRKLGTLKTDKQGVGKRLVKLTKQYRGIPVTFCLKNTTTDAVQCKVYKP